MYMLNKSDHVIVHQEYTTRPAVLEQTIILIRNTSGLCSILSSIMIFYCLWISHQGARKDEINKPLG